MLARDSMWALDATHLVRDTGGRAIEAEEIVREAAKVGAEIVWMQPGASSEEGIAEAKKLGLRVIADGPCVLKELP